MKACLPIALAALIAGCAAVRPEQQPSAAQAADCRPELERANAQLRAASRREESLKKQLDALKSIERGILDREERRQLQAR